nr:hypothetical protein [Anaeromonas gelatinilytica]
MNFIILGVLYIGLDLDGIGAKKITDIIVNTNKVTSIKEFSGTFIDAINIIKKKKHEDIRQPL